MSATQHPRFQILISLASVIVTVVIAYFAYEIQKDAQEIQTEIAESEAQRAKDLRHLEEQRAAVSRSVALYRDFSESEAIKNLSDYRHAIQHRSWSQSKSKSTVHEGEEREKENKREREHIAHTSSKVLEESREDVLKWFAVLFQKTTVIYNCSGLKNKYEQQKSPTLCDPETIFILLHDPLSELFFYYRSQFYCDEYIKSQFGGGKLYTPLSRFESLMIDFLEREFRDRKWGIFRERAEYDDAVKNKTIDSKSNDYSIMRYHDSC